MRNELPFIKWVVMYYDFNERKIKSYNALNRGIVGEIREEIKKGLIHDKNSLIEKLDSKLKYYYAHKREWEISVGDLYETDLDKYEKVSVYDELKENIPVMASYLISAMGLDFGKKTKLKERVKEETLTNYDFAKDKNLIIEDLLNIIDHYKEEIRDLKNMEK